MTKYLKKLLAFFICSFALLLPYRLQILLSEALGWIINTSYRLYFDLIKFILRKLEE